MSNVNEVTAKILEVLESCNFRPNEEQNQTINSLYDVLSDEEQEEVSYAISAKVAMSRAQSTGG